MTGATVRLVVPPEAEGRRLDQFLTDAIPDRTRSSLRRLVDEGRVRVNGSPARKPGLALHAGAEVDVTIPAPPPERPAPETIPVAIVYEDDDLAVVLKPAGLVVHPGHGARTGTLVNALLGRPMPLAPAGGRDRPGIVHRLDRDTSGLVVVAKSDRAHRGLVQAFARRSVRKTYLALVWGRPEPPEGRIDSAIGRSRADRTKMTVRAARGRAAITVFRTVERLPGMTLLEIDLVTGRTHQIRVHMAASGHPVVGDTRYGGSPWRNVRDPGIREAVRSFKRLALHAARIEFDHPTTGSHLAFEAPLPAEFEALVDLLRESR